MTKKYRNIYMQLMFVCHIKIILQYLHTNCHDLLMLNKHKYILVIVYTENVLTFVIITVCKLYVPLLNPAFVHVCKIGILTLIVFVITWRDMKICTKWLIFIVILLEHVNELRLFSCTVMSILYVASVVVLDMIVNFTVKWCFLVVVFILFYFEIELDDEVLTSREVGI